jgi:hypothetical protein
MPVPISARITCALARLIPGDLIQASHRVGERGGLRRDPLVQGGDVGGDRVDPA